METVSNDSGVYCTYHIFVQAEWGQPAHSDHERRLSL